ncbi:MAG: methyltransferase, TrmH family, group 2 [Gammaproteobacteria bacterium]|jgi:tRNA (cytidine/uridine-2'-O-)-methyltransferase|nr:methyltransferase, TrmH family, group 2 [Gammaproteobacteria bacterium]
MFNIVLFEPEIPPNTGNIIRLCANTGSRLHLICPLGFELDDKQLKRAGLDYREWVNVEVHQNFAAFIAQHTTFRIFAYSTKGNFRYDEIAYQANDVLLFGPETRGLPPNILTDISIEAVARIPMVPNNRSLNLSNATAVVLYEAWRQQGFE